MASKSYVRSQKDKSPKQNGKTYQDALSDEIALRDEILELKRQMLVLKRTNEQNLVKFRKYEDEAKRKDKQIEQLMDPTKNSDIRKILSTKGAAILMNLKDQNNALIQMILDKDLQIKRLLGELKTSKLYASSRKTEPYRTEIARLRNLLIKSQELLKEATDIPQKRSICVGGTPVLEMNSSSDQSSPRELEELRFTIQSLETHMKYSNDLLAKKNQEIMILTDQLNAARNAYQCKTCNKNMTIKPSHEYDLDPKKYDWFEAEKIVDKSQSLENLEISKNKSPREKKLNTVEEQNSTIPLPPKSKTSSTAELLELFEKTMMVSKERKLKTKIPKSAPVGTVRAESKESVSRRSSMPVLTEKSNGSCDADISNEQTTHEPISTEETLDTGRMSLTMSNGTSDDLEKSISKLLSSREKRRSKSLLHDLATGSLEENQEAKSPNDEAPAKEKWKSAVKKLRKSQRRKRSDASHNTEKSHKSTTKTSHRRKSKSDKEKPTKISDASGNDTDVEALEMYEFEMMEKKIENDQIEIESLIKPDQILERITETPPKSPGSSKLIRQSRVVHSEEGEEPEIQPEDKKETPTKSRKVSIAKDPPLLTRRLSMKAESPRKSKIAVASSRKSSTSSVSKSSVSSKSESSSKKSIGKSPRDLSKNLRKLSRNKNMDEPPVPMRRTKITKIESVQEKPPTPPPVSLTRRLSTPNLDLCHTKDEKSIPETKNIEEMPDEITTYEITQEMSDTQQIKEEINNISSRFSPEIQKELQSLYDNITSFEEIEKKKGKSLREVYKQSIDSSFDSENSSTTKQEIKVVEVEVEINQMPMQSSESFQSQQSVSQETVDGKSAEKKEGGENFFGDDDDDVVFG